MPDGANVKPGSIAAKRRGARLSAIKSKVDNGTVTGEERGLVRMGKTNTRIMTGQEDLSLWTDEELKRGQRKDKNGGWRGVPPKVVPKAIHNELVKRTLANAHELLRENLDVAVSVLTEIVDDPTVEAKDRLRAVAMIMDRVMGKDPIPIQHGGETPPWQVAIQAGIVSIKGADLLSTDEDDDTGTDEEE